MFQYRKQPIHRALFPCESRDLRNTAIPNQELSTDHVVNLIYKPNRAPFDSLKGASVPGLEINKPGLKNERGPIQII